MNRHIFVYGTLLSSAQHPKGERLRREAQLVGEGSIAGELYSLGRYPGLVEAPEGVVHGEVYALNNPAVSLKWLDAYEGISSDAANNQYERCERPVRLASGEDVKAWVYLFRASVKGCARISEGRWSHRHG